jgi:DNA mismatch repair protein MutS2
MYKDSYEPRDMATTGEIYLRHLTVEEAFPILEKSLLAAYEAGFTRVRIIHGKGGTGALRQMVNRELRKNPLVKSYRVGVGGEGGNGVTVVELSDT